MEPLVEIPRSEWTHLLEEYETKWPKGAGTTCFLDMQLSHPNFMESFDFKIYSPFGATNNGIVVITDKFGWYDVTICPLSDINKIEEALLNTELIDWDRKVTFPAATPDVENCLKKLSNKLRFKIIHEEEVCTYALGKQSQPYDNLKQPPDTSNSSVKPEHIKVIDETWTYHSDITYLYFEIIAKNGLTYVLYYKDDIPAAWVNVGTEGFLSHWYCIEPYRKRGYGEYILKYAINDQLKKNKHVLAYTVRNNKVAQNMFSKFGFENIGNYKWIVVSRD